MSSSPSTRSISSSYRKEVFDRIAGDYTAFAAQLGFSSIVPIPISARFGDNVIESVDQHALVSRALAAAVSRNRSMSSSETSAGPFRFPVQWVNRPNLDFRGYAGTVVSGKIEVGDPDRRRGLRAGIAVKEIVIYDGSLASAEAGDAMTLTLDRRSRRCAGRHSGQPVARPEVSDQFAAHVIWMSDEPLVPGRSYLARIGPRRCRYRNRAQIQDRRQYRASIWPHDTSAERHRILQSRDRCVPVAFDPYEQNRQDRLLHPH